MEVDLDMGLEMDRRLEMEMEMDRMLELEMEMEMCLQMDSDLERVNEIVWCWRQGWRRRWIWLGGIDG